MPTHSFDYLLEATRQIFVAAGATPAEAEAVASGLVRANLVGHDSHGIIRIPQYLASLQQGDIVAGGEVEVVAQTPATAVLDGHWGFGQPIAYRAARMGVDKARDHGVSAITVRRSNHMGRMGEYVESVAQQGAIGLLFCNMHGSGACVVPWGGSSPRLGTNPLAVGIPRTDGGALVLDMTTSVVAEGKVRVLRNRGEAVPEGWILDGDGRPSTDPMDFYSPDKRGSLLPFGGEAGHKGYGLNVVIDLLAGALSGASTTGGREARQGNAVFLLVVDISQFVPPEDFHAAVDEFEDFVKSSAPAPGYDQILMPGDPEVRQSERRGAEGIYVEDETWAQVVGCAAELGVELEAQ
ncbi:Ldh family oxidoreductase [Candidatus Latescibacterota bacterium]